VLVDAPPVVPAPRLLELEEPVFDPWFVVPFVWTGRAASAVTVGCSDVVGAGASTLVLGVVGCCDSLEVAAPAEALGEGFVLLLELWEVWEPDRENAVAAAKTVARNATIGNAGPNTRMMLSGIPGNPALPVLLPTLPAELAGAAAAVGATTV